MNAPPPPPPPNFPPPSPEPPEVEVSDLRLRIAGAGQTLLEGDWEFKAPMASGLLPGCSQTLRQVVGDPAHDAALRVHAGRSLPAPAKIATRKIISYY